MKNNLKILSVLLLVLLMFGSITSLTACSQEPSQMETWLMAAEFDRDDINEQQIRRLMDALDPDEYIVTEVEERNELIICKKQDEKNDLWVIETYFFPTVNEAKEYYTQLCNLGLWHPSGAKMYVRINGVVFFGQGILSKKFMEDLGVAVPKSEWLPKEKYFQKIPDDITLDTIVQYMTSHGYRVSELDGIGDLLAIRTYDGENPMRSFTIDKSMNLEHWETFPDNIDFSVFYNSEYMVYCMSDQWLTLLDEVEAWLEEREK